MSREILQEQLNKMRRRRLAQPLSPAIRRAKDEIVAWQVARINETYADLRAQPRVRPTVEFFNKEVYAERDFQKRDQDLERVSGLLSRFLPTAALRYLAQVIELNVLTEELDTRMAYAWHQHPQLQGSRFNLSNWMELCRHCDDEQQRRRLVDITWDGGKRLDAISRHPGLGVAMRLAHRPAELAGVGELFRVMHEGYEAFRQLPSVEDFLKTLVTRESQLLDRIWK